mmetsp:Transcript_13027/g.15814  ORF Transcript_13027/g.15814 Transcript_13027/m.15814 type:complete len:113 (+) Transcript_13027:122-460(+)
MAEEVKLAAKVEFLVWKAEEAAERLQSYKQKEVINTETIRELRYGSLGSQTGKDEILSKSWVCVGDWYLKLTLQEAERLLHQNQSELQTLKAKAQTDLERAQQELERLSIQT